MAGGTRCPVCHRAFPSSFDLRVHKIYDHYGEFMDAEVVHLNNLADFMMRHDWVVSIGLSTEYRYLTGRNSGRKIYVEARPMGMDPDVFCIVRLEVDGVVRPHLRLADVQNLVEQVAREGVQRDR